MLANPIFKARLVDVGVLPLAACMALAITGLACLGLLPAHAEAFSAAWRLSLCALGFGLFFSPNARMLIGNAPRKRAAAAGGLLSTGRLFGQTLGAASAGLLLTLGGGHAAVATIFAMAFALLAALCSLARLWVMRRS
jgi:DHA2 family multidrug resistance protein-like MFS transporter